MLPTYRLADSLIAEPLVHGWGAWWLTIAPIPAALHDAHVQRPAMRSYLENPALHEQMARDPSLSGNPCIGVAPEQAHEVAALLASSERSFAGGVALAEAVGRLQSDLLAWGKGQSLEPLYAKVPAPLRGLVELVYDYCNRPSLRIIEPLVYRSNHYQPERQSLRLRHLESDDDRPFLFSTPHVTRPGEWRWQLPYASPRLDEFFRLDIEPRPLHEIFDLCEADAPAQATLKSLLTDAPLPSRPSVEDLHPRVTYLGHATVLIEARGVTLLIDPFLSAEPRRGGARRWSFQHLPARIDYVLVTHAHPDHFSLETLLRLRHRIGCLIVPRASGFLLGDVSLRLMAETLGFRDVREMDVLQSVPVPGGEIIGVPFLGEHGDLAHAKSAYVVRLGHQQMLFAADSACLDPVLYERVREAIGPVPTVFLNTETEGSPAAYTIEALFPQDRDRAAERDRRCRGSTSGEALQLLQAVGARCVYNYAMGLEPWFQHVLGPAPRAGSARLRDSDDLLQRAMAAGLARAQQLQGPQAVALTDPDGALDPPSNDIELTI
jgi:L-ascorbate metabolism protein UlaG (beta-lactamase superfamily)